MSRETILNKIIDRIDREITQLRKAKPLKESIGCGFHAYDKYIRYAFGEGWVEISIYDEKKQTWLDNISQWLEKRVVKWESIDVEEEQDEWNLNGFRDEEDFYKWKL